jgi:hypothetical protein
MAHQATSKKGIKPVTLTITVEAKRINENGTFSGFEVKSVKGPNSTFKVAIPPQGGGAIYLKVDRLEGITVLTDGEATTATTKVKLF